MNRELKQADERGIEQKQVGSKQTRMWLLVIAAVAILAILVGNRPAGSAQESVASSGIDVINVDSGGARVIFSPGPAGTIGVELNSSSGGHELEVSQDGRALNVSVTRRSWPPAFLSFSRASVEITLPPSAAPDIDVEVRSGGVEVAELNLGSARFSSRSGGISVDDVRSEGDLVLLTASGGIRVNETTVNGQLHAETASGGVTLSEVRADGYRLGTRSGRISGGDLTGGGLVADARSGGITLAADTLLGDWELSTGSGRVEVRLESPPQSMRVQYSGGSGGWSLADSYGLTVSETGRNSFSAARGDGGPLIQVRTGSGGFTLR